MALVAPQNYMPQAVQNPFLQGLQGFQMAQQMAAQRDALAAQREEQAQKAQMKADIAAFSEKPNKGIDDYQNLMVKYPQLSQTLQRSFENMNEEQKKNKIGELTTLYGFLSNNKTEDAKNYLDTLRTAYENSGDNAAAISLKSIKESLDMQPEGPQAALNMAELQLYKAMGKDAFERMIAQRKGGLERTQSSQILPDGTSIFLTSKNNIVVKNAAGEVLSGKDAINAVREAQSYGVDIAAEKAKLIEENKQIQRKEYEPQIERGKAEEKQAVTLSGQYAERLDKINENILTLDEAANRIQEGLDKGEDLGIGPIRQFLPKLSAAAQDMRSIANRLGLGVVSSVTFGALSEGELKLAMSTGLPTGMKGQDLLNWIQDRKAAQQKLANYLENAAIYLGEPGHTLADFRKMMKEKKGQSPVQTQTIQSNQNLSNIPAAERLKMLTGQ